eukprot:CAMPEP_0117499568 /NCGR_PEP_ID=MMETSP0784-20121206/22312_1 /TAXON_ID=39447 /ORGANISM="" /LENGTH=128 /DNA_ID=CAMNT_0005294719 /DNA_START=263 /DNA_END=645 /DNA_ORIENTATION=+
MATATGDCIFASCLTSRSVWKSLPDFNRNFRRAARFASFLLSFPDAFLASSAASRSSFLALSTASSASLASFFAMFAAWSACVSVFFFVFMGRLKPPPLRLPTCFPMPAALYLLGAAATRRSQWGGIP